MCCINSNCFLKEPQMAVRLAVVVFQCSATYHGAKSLNELDKDDGKDGV